MAFCHNGNTRLAYQQMGEGPDVVLIHGLATNRAFWYANLAQRLKADYRVTLFDLRGHGYSDRADSGYAATDMVGDLAAVMDAADIGQAAIAGHSYGGGVGLEFAVAHPERVERLAILDTKINRFQPYHRMTEGLHLTRFEQEIQRTVAHDWATEPQLGLTYLATAARLCVEGRMPATRDIYTPFGEGRSGRRLARQFLKLIEQTSALDDFTRSGAEAARLEALAMPLLMIYGDHSHCLDSAQALHALQPGARYVTIPQAGHFFPASHPQALAEELLPFLRQAPDRVHNASPGAVYHPSETHQ